MIVVGIDPHKRTQTAVAVDQGTGEHRAELTADARQPGHEELLCRARELDAERRFAIEDCRHVSGALERFLIGHGERVVRVAPRLMGQRPQLAQLSQVRRDRCPRLARAALREPQLPEAHLAGAELEVKGGGPWSSCSAVAKSAGSGVKLRASSQR